ncbi:MAG: flagellin [Fusobacteriaceae bacterium]|nr:flagellin [Fusobacteriaceae bacterium]MBN2837732.1 flagellin [Fusobacteriaceae bacterium]
MRINHNIAAMNAYRNLTITNDKIDSSLERLSSGLRINRSADDAAGLAISEKMRAQIRGLRMASKNSSDAISLIQTAEGALNETHAILQRMRELAVQSANDSNTDNDRAAIQQEIEQLRQELDRISKTTEFNTKKLITGEFAESGLYFQVGANKGQTVNMKLGKMDAESLGLASVPSQVPATNPDGSPKLDANGNVVLESKGGTVSVATQGDANNAIELINKALESVSVERSKYGAMQNRLEHTINNLRVSEENLQSAESRIRDADMANEITEFSKNKIIAQSGTAMLAQANASPQGILQLLNG